MLEWLKRQLNKIKDFFARFWKATPVSSVSKDVPMKAGDNYSLNIAAILANKPDLFRELKINAFKNVDHAKQLLQRNDLKNHVNYEELCALIYTHRKELDIVFIGEMLKRNGISFLDLAKHSAKNALILLKSRFLNEFKADELARIYFAHRKDPVFLSALLEKREPNTRYPSAVSLPTISYILIKAHDQGIAKSVVNFIKQSTILLRILLYIELDPGQDKEQHREHRNAVQLPEENPYEVLGLGREASVNEINKAFRKKARLVHPDKVETLNASRFKAVSEAYQFLIDPDKRKAWDDKHPLDSAVPTARNG